MAEFTRHTRLPLERAIEFVEQAIEPTDHVLLAELQNRCKVEAPEAQSMLDHTIQVMIRGGYIRRRSFGPDRLGYEKTDRWTSRDETLILLRAPKHKYRFRPRSKGKRIYPVAGTVDQAREMIRAIPTQQDLFGGVS